MLFAIPSNPILPNTLVIQGSLARIDKNVDNLRSPYARKLKLIAIKGFSSLVFSVFRLFEGRKVLEKCKRHLKLFDDNLVEAAAVSTGGFSIMATPNIRAALKRLVHSHYSNEGLPIVAKVED